MDAFTKLGEIIGITYSEEVINNLFKNFVSVNKNKELI